ncbi:hypothetical protein V5O48_016684 [Marasmius crinis-equi]|uniref:CCHC-type domain-containing protein n=1 Tax=Marasmius crinis-equi TaxID=585013 RepID=A0ABR3ER23_9AGAR
MFTAKPTIYSTEESQVTYGSSWLTGAAGRTYQNWVEKEWDTGVYNPILHEWQPFVRELTRLFGVHDEQMHAQALLDKVWQKFTESFADFWVRFEDASIKTKYNDHALRWKLLRQTRPELRSRLTYAGRIPDGYTEVVDRLLDIDGSREAFNEAGLTTGSETISKTATPPRFNNSNQQGNQGGNTTTSANSPGGRNQRPNYSRTAQATASSASTSTIPNNSTIQPNPSPSQPQPGVIHITQQERDRRLRGGLCLRCAEAGHIGRNCPTFRNMVSVLGRAAFEVSKEVIPQLELTADSNGDLFQTRIEDEEEELQEQSSEFQEGNDNGTQNLNEGEN